MSGDRFTSFMNREIANINKHLPVKVFNLEQVMKLKEPGYVNRSREFVEIDKNELEFIRDSLPVTYYRRMEIPIYLTRRRDLGQGLYVVGGSEANLYIIKKCLDESIERFDIWRLKPLKDEDRYIYNYQLATIRKKLPTTTIQAFA